MLHKAEIWTGLPMPDSLTHSQMKDRATQLLIKYKSGALVTQCECIMWQDRSFPIERCPFCRLTFSTQMRRDWRIDGTLFTLKGRRSGYGFCETSNITVRNAKALLQKMPCTIWQYILTSSGEPLPEELSSVRFCESQELSALAVQMSRSHLNPYPTMTIA